MKKTFLTGRRIHKMGGQAEVNGSETSDNIKFTALRDDLPDLVLDKLSEANVFFTREYYNYTKNRNEEIYYLWNNKYILPIRVKRVFIFSAGLLDSEPFCLSSENSLKYEKVFMNKCCEYIKKNHLLDWIQSEISANFLVYPDNAVVYGAGNYILNIENYTDEELFGKLHSKNRNMVRRGKREGVTVLREGDELISDYKKVEDQVWERNKAIPRNMEYYMRISEYMPNTSSYAVAYKDGIPEAGALFLYTKTMGYYHHGASKTKPTPGAHNYLIWDEILYLKHLGVRKINFVGYRREKETVLNSKALGIQKFKEKFGGDVLLTYSFKYEFSRIKYKLYRIGNLFINKEQIKDHYNFRKDNYPEYNKK